jgi:predicted transposase YbfD/YdcC
MRKLMNLSEVFWGIENQVHWVLDMAFLEDRSRVRVGHGAENLTALLRLAVKILRQDRSSNMGIKARQMKAAWDLSYLLHLFSMEVPDADS